MDSIGINRLSTEQEYLEIINSSVLGSFVRDLEKGEINYSAEWKKRLGIEHLSHKEAADTMMTRVHPDDRTEMINAYTQACACQLPRIKFEFRARTDDQEYIWILCETKIIYNQEGKPVKYFGTHMDISERKRLDEVLRDSEKQYRELVEHAPAGIYEIDFRTKLLTSVNDAMCLVSGYSREELLGMNAFELLDEESKILFKTRMDRWLKGEKLSSNVEYKVKTKDGRKIDTTLAMTFTTDEQGRPKGATVIMHDISERKLAEEALRESEKKALELEILKEADKNKNQFISALSHELRNPLASMMMSLSLLKLADQNSQQALQAREIFGRQTIQLSRLVDDLLEVTRINQNKIKLKKELTELNDLIMKTIKDCRQMFAEKGVSLEFNRFPELIYMQADQTRLTQVIGNLLHNAHKFTDKDGKTQVTVPKDDKNKQAVITVKDNGKGIKLEQLPDLFQPFIQADVSLDRSSGGLGLGLVIVKGMVELHGGSVAAHSEGLGRGSEFMIRIPLTAEQESEQEIKYQPECKVTSRRRILVIDDIEDVAEIICSLLRHLGHEVISVPNGFKGLSKAKDFKPDIVFCDIGLPGMNGYEVAGQIRMDDQLKDIYLIALSGYAQEGDLEKSKKAGFNCHLAKPVDLAKLEEILNQDLEIAESNCGRT